MCPGCTYIHYILNKFIVYSHPATRPPPPSLNFHQLPLSVQQSKNENSNFAKTTYLPWARYEIGGTDANNSKPSWMFLGMLSQLKRSIPDLRLHKTHQPLIGKFDVLSKSQVMALRVLYCIKHFFNICVQFLFLSFHINAIMKHLNLNISPHDRKLGSYLSLHMSPHAMYTSAYSSIIPLNSVLMHLI